KVMMAGNRPRSNPTVQIPGWDHRYAEDPTVHIQSPISHGLSAGGSPDGPHFEQALAALQRFLPSNSDDAFVAEGEDFDVPVDAFSCDNFRMFEFKVKKCALARSHDWTACPFAHPGEKARRRDPRKCHYSGTACPEFRKGACKRGDACEYSHGVFECWLHPARYRTQPCKDGTHCRRRVCFFAHTPEQLRVLPYSSAASPEASPGRFVQDSNTFFSAGPFGTSPTSALYSPPPSPPTSGSPPVSPSGSMTLSQLASSMRSLHINKMKLNLGLSGSPPSWGLGVGSPPTVRPGFISLPSTPIPAGKTPRGLAWGPPYEEEPEVERVESGKELRERIYAKLGKENSLHRVGRVDPSVNLVQDFGWVGELV
ncbi:hypothetical protein M569_17020, partial [Genlisea aurea]